jgi:hypothetical protein
MIDQREPDRPPDWTDAEPSFSDVVREVSRLKRRAMAQRWLTLLITITVTALLVVREVRKPKTYPATIVLAVTEKVIDENVIPETNSSFRDYLANAIFTDARLTELMAKFKIRSQAFLEAQPQLALESFREDLEIEVYRNTFLEYEAGGHEDREARIRLVYYFRDPKIALDVVRALGQMVILHEIESRQAQVEIARIHNEVAVEQAQAEVATLERTIAEKQYLMDRSPTPAVLRYELFNLNKSLKSAISQLDTTRKEGQGLELVGSLEEQSGGLQFDVADWGRADDPMPVGRLAIILSFVLFFALLPLVGIGVGALDPRVYDAEDVERLGLTALGKVRCAPLPPPRSRPHVSMS